MKVIQRAVIEACHGGVLFATMAVCLASGAREWLVSLQTVNGMTPSQQLTNAVKQASAGDTIRFEAGTYQLDGSSFTATDRDLAGNLRLRDGRLDPGCFQCWLIAKGTCVLFR